MLTEQETLLGRGTQAEQEGKGPRRTALPRGSLSRGSW